MVTAFALHAQGVSWWWSTIGTSYLRLSVKFYLLNLLANEPLLSCSTTKSYLCCVGAGKLHALLRTDPCANKFPLFDNLASDSRRGLLLFFGLADCVPRTSST